MKTPEERAREFVLSEKAWIDDGYSPHEDTYLAGYREAIEDAVKACQGELRATSYLAPRSPRNDGVWDAMNTIRNLVSGKKDG